MKIRAINHTDPILKKVIELGDKNSKTLGHFPEGAFIDHARKENIIVALEGEELLGYIYIGLRSTIVLLVSRIYVFLESIGGKVSPQSF